MKRTTIALAAALLASMGLAGPAAADFTVYSTIDKTKTVTVTEDISITKVIQLVDISVDVPIDSAADALAIVNQSIFGNTYGQGLDDEVSHSASISSSIGYEGAAGNHGITAVNQDAGALSNQANAGAFAMTNEADAFINAEASAEQILGAHTINFLNALVGSYVSAASIVDSIQGNVGITHVNQNSGVINTQLNSLAVAVGLGGDPDTVGPESNSFAMAEADLGQETSGITITEGWNFIDGDISNSIRQNVGVVGVNQAAGNGALQANLVALSAAKIGQ